jgi:putative restriction endonuclease
MRAQVPVIYLLGIAPGRYTAHFPTFIVNWDPAQLRAGIAFGAPVNTTEAAAPPETAERKYALRLVRQRLHQARFREAVLSAYGSRCAITGLPEPRLLDAAHIIGDLEDEGLPIVPNGLPLSKVHHAAFDANLIGVDADFKIHVSDALLSIDDGPMFEQGVKLKHGATIRLPKRRIDYPDRDRLAARFELFQANRLGRWATLNSDMARTRRRRSLRLTRRDNQARPRELVPLGQREQRRSSGNRQIVRVPGAGPAVSSRASMLTSRRG